MTAKELKAHVLSIIDKEAGKTSDFEEMRADIPDAFRTVETAYLYGMARALLTIESAIYQIKTGRRTK